MGRIPQPTVAKDQQLGRPRKWGRRFWWHQSSILVGLLLAVLHLEMRGIMPIGVSSLKCFAWGWTSQPWRRRRLGSHTFILRGHSTFAPPAKNLTDVSDALANNVTAATKDILRDWTKWRETPELNPVVTFPTVVVTPGNIHALVSSPQLKPFFASEFDLMKHVQRRLKLVRDLNDSKMLLLHPETFQSPSKAHEWHTALQSVTNNGSLSRGPDVSIRLRPRDFSVPYVLSLFLAEQAPTSFESIGHVAHLNLPKHIMPYRYLVGQVILECLSPLRTVICKTDQVRGPYRTYDFEVVAGNESTWVQHVENGVQLEFDVQKVYWSSRLSQERKRLLSLFQPGQVIADAFCGVGALCLQAAKKNCVVLANDWNPDAIASLVDNAKRNNVQVTAHCGDSYEFLVDLGLSLDSKSQLPDHVVMNYPLEAPRFLGALRWWPTKRDDDSAGNGPRVHVYTFARDDEKGRTAEESAVEAIASHLVVSSNFPGTTAQQSRAAELDTYGCRVSAHHVRDVAPGKKVYCVSFTATPKLIRYMQGDFS